jgi:hypothetical protein
MLILPVVAPAGTTARICVFKSTTKTAVVSLNLTALTLPNPPPVIVTSVPTGPFAGVNEVMTNGGSTVKFVALKPVPSEFVALINPVEAPIGTVARICVSESTLKTAGMPLKATAVVPSKALPVIVTSVVALPLSGVKEAIAGGAGSV